SVFKSFWAVAGKVPCVVCGTAPPEGTPEDLGFNYVGFVARENVADGLETLIEELIQKQVIVKDARPEGDLVRIKTGLLISVTPLKADIYIRLSDTHFVKMFRTGDSFDRADLEKYKNKKGVEYFYLRAEDTSEFIEKYKKEILSWVGSKELTMEMASQSAESAVDVIQQLNKTLGFTEE